MSLALDSIFATAIRANSTLMERIGKRLWSTAIPYPDEKAINVPVPYVIVTLDGVTNEQTTKDDPFESEDDQVNIGVIVTASSRVQLAEVAKDVRSAIHAYMVENYASTGITGYQFSADGVQYDQFKPCYWQTLRYVCDVTNDDNEQEED